MSKKSEAILQATKDFGDETQAKNFVDAVLKGDTIRAKAAFASGVHIQSSKVTDEQIHNMSKYLNIG